MPHEVLSGETHTCQFPNRSFSTCSVITCLVVWSDFQIVFFWLIFYDFLEDDRYVLKILIKSNKVGLYIFVQSGGILLNAVPSFYEFIISLMPAIVRFISSSLM